MDLKGIDSMASAYAFGEAIHYSDQSNTFSPEQLAQHLASLGHKDVEVARTSLTCLFSIPPHR